MAKITAAQGIEMFGDALKAHSSLGADGWQILPKGEGWFKPDPTNPAAKAYSLTVYDEKYTGGLEDFCESHGIALAADESVVGDGQGLFIIKTAGLQDWDGDESEEGYCNWCKRWGARTY